MAQFDVYRLKRGGSLVLDCQSSLLGDLKTRLVVPLIIRKEAPTPAQRLNPIFAIAGQDCVMVTQFAAAVSKDELGPLVASLERQSFEIIAALDVLISGV